MATLVRRALVEVCTVPLLLVIIIILRLRGIKIKYHKIDRHPFNGLFSRTMWASWHQKGQTNLDFNEAREVGLAVASAVPHANHLHLAANK